MDRVTLFDPQSSVSPKIVTIEYPGSVQNHENAIKSLGGISRISQDIIQKNTVNIKYRMDDPFCHPIPAYGSQVNGVLIRVNYKRNKKSNKTSDPRITVVGTVSKNFQFIVMSDFQIVTPENIRNDFGGIFGEEILKTHQDIFTHTRLFSVIRHPCKPRADQNTLKKLESTSTSDKIDVSESITNVLMEMDELNDVKSSKTFEYINYISPVPSAVSIPPNSNPTSLENVIYRLFQDRPIYTIKELMELTGVSYYLVKESAIKVSYYIVDGPWKRQWIRKGYDPKLHWESYIYQIIDYRSYKNTPSVDNSFPVLSRSFHSKFCWVYMRVSDITDENVQYFLTENLQKENCTKSDGWFISGTIDEARKMLK